MSAIARTRLDAWAAEKIGGTAFSREQLERYQLAKLRATVDWALDNSPFYRDLLAGRAGTSLDSLADLSLFPFTTADDLRRHGPRFLCVSQSDISRVVTLDSSGTTGAAKRLYFTPADREATLAFFSYGMANLVEKGDKVLILLPGERPGGVGDLLATALQRGGIRPVPHGFVRSLSATLAVIAREQTGCLVGAPAQVLALARWAESDGLALPVKSVLLSTDHVPRIVVSELKRIWGCDVFEHYGMTELGLGGGTDCAAHAGCHLHEADFLFEIVDPATGVPMPAGEEGEVVVTTLVRRGMPLIRYRTGDISRIIPGPCLCGSPLRRLAPVARRKDGFVALGGHGGFTLADLDEALFAIPGLTGFTAAVDNRRRATRLTITASLAAAPGGERKLSAALETVPAIRHARQAGDLAVALTVGRCRGELEPGAAKRAIVELN
ncbi:DVU_1553 family AMP-dependent CoA ligase [Anaeroselena agilis]|uniref:AMP-binding protein n=1 Tax=Anaeroselena agilis TaxID=3063788 RepID=A0ABU3NXY7_9FIRM|nr:AMP-binding protein [Selenomonadales bacterium 4137-cl]